jgi:RNA polymerase sigma factor (sigma-70 family)
VGALSTCTLRHASDDRLVALTRAGSERAFAEIMRRYQRPLHFYCLHMVGAPRAEDAVQQAFMQAFVSLRDGARREIALRPWLYRIARNCAIDLLRKQPADHDELDPDYDGMPQPPGVFEQKEELARVVAAIQALPEGQRRALTLRELEGRSYGEISAELGHTDSGVRQLIFRARTALRNLGAFILPVGSTRWRLFGGPASPVADPHHVVAAATASSGGGTSALQAAASVVAATVTLLGASASGAPRERGESVSPAPVASAAPGQSARPALGAHESGSTDHGRARSWHAEAVGPVEPAADALGAPAAAIAPADAGVAPVTVEQPVLDAPAPVSVDALGAPTGTTGATQPAPAAAPAETAPATAGDGAPAQATTQPATVPGPAAKPVVSPVKAVKPVKAPAAPKVIPPKPPKKAASKAPATSVKPAGVSGT